MYKFQFKTRYHSTMFAWEDILPTIAVQFSSLGNAIIWAKQECNKYPHIDEIRVNFVRDNQGYYVWADKGNS